MPGMMVEGTMVPWYHGTMGATLPPPGVPCPATTPLNAPGMTNMPGNRLSARLRGELRNGPLVDP